VIGDLKDKRIPRNVPGSRVRKRKSQILRGNGADGYAHHLRDVMLDGLWCIEEEELKFVQIKGGSKGFTRIIEIQ